MKQILSYLLRKVHLIVYVDDIVITRNDATKSSRPKRHICNHFQTKNLGCLKYFLGIEVAQSNEGIVICQRKNALDPTKNNVINCRPIDSPMNLNQKFMSEQSEPFLDFRKI